MRARLALPAALLCAATVGCAPHAGDTGDKGDKPTPGAPASPTGPARPSLDPDLAKKAEEKAKATPPGDAIPQCEHVFSTRIPETFGGCLDNGQMRFATPYPDCENKKLMYAVDDWGWGFAGESAHRGSWADGGIQSCYPSLYGLPVG